MKKSPAFLPKALLAAVSIGAMASCTTSVSRDRAVAADGRAIHRPEQLNDFYLKEPVKLDGLGTKAALQKLDRAYRETCRKAGEVPLGLAYEVPAGYHQPLNFTVTESFEQGVAEIAATSKLEVARRGNTYHFQAPRGGDGLVRQKYQVPPDFVHRISDEPQDTRLPVSVAFERRGVSFDKSTRLTMKDSWLGLETRDRGDAAAIFGTVEIVKKGYPLEIRLETQTFEIPAGRSWDGPENGIISGEDLAKLRRIRGVKEIAQPFDLRSNKPSQGYIEGGKLSVQFGFLGLGVQGKAVFDQAAPGSRPVVVEGQTPDGVTRIASQTRPDGSRVVVAVTPTAVDATLRPVKRSR
ncbi:hypothetical protein WKV53_08565 [Luteolibacter sp. Y139]|uniref:Uncharacterized protein n=2 Tax=Luteolibacter soli TaxID=3135280 RepID=A0ABU9AS52_9BACT